MTLGRLSAAYDRLLRGAIERRWVTSENGDYLEARCQWEKAVMLVRLTFDDSERVTGFWLARDSMGPTPAGWFCTHRVREGPPSTRYGRRSFASNPVAYTTRDAGRVVGRAGTGASAGANAANTQARSAGVPARIGLRRGSLVIDPCIPSLRRGRRRAPERQSSRSQLSGYSAIPDPVRAVSSIAPSKGSWPA